MHGRPLGSRSGLCSRGSYMRNVTRGYLIVCLSFKPIWSELEWILELKSRAAAC